MEPLYYKLEYEQACSQYPAMEDDLVYRLDIPVNTSVAIFMKALRKCHELEEETVRLFCPTERLEEILPNKKASSLTASEIALLTSPATPLKICIQRPLVEADMDTKYHSAWMRSVLLYRLTRDAARKPMLV